MVPGAVEAPAIFRKSCLRRRAAVVGILVLASACTGGTDGEAPLARRPELTTVPAASSPTTAGLASTTVVPAPPATSTPGAGFELRPAGLGSVDFGIEAEVALAEFASVLGVPSDDDTLGSCASGEIDRVVRFGELSILLGGGRGTRFVGWDLGERSGALPSLATAEGVSVGSSLDDVRRAFGTRFTLLANDPFGAAFEVEVGAPGALRGTLTGVGGDDRVATLSGGAASCAA